MPSDTIELLKDADAYDDSRFAALVETIENEGIDGAFEAIELRDGQKVTIVGQDGMFVAHGPGVLFVTMLPMEMFERD